MPGVARAPAEPFKTFGSKPDGCLVYQHRTIAWALTQYILDGHMPARHICHVVEVIGTDEFAAWFDGLDDKQKDDTARVVDMLESAGVTLPFPLSSAIKGSKVAMRELRIQSGGNPLRVFYVFDPKRQAVLLIGGDKTGDDRFYDRMVPLAEKIWAQYQKEGHV